eukprot:178332-Pelagomonas_calceolata.AAC.1
MSCHIIVIARLLLSSGSGSLIGGMRYSCSPGATGGAECCQVSEICMTVASHDSELYMGFTLVNLQPEYLADQSL